MNSEAQPIRNVARIFGISTATVRRYCSQGLIPHVRRDSNGYRVLETWQIDLLKVLLNMKQAGFPHKELRRYSRLFRQGKHTEAERLAMLTTRKRQLWHEIETRQKAIDFIERQEEIAKNPEILSEKTSV